MAGPGSQQPDTEQDGGWTPVPASEVPSAIISGAGLSTVLRIPIPGVPGMAVEFWGRDLKFKGKSTSVLFIQDITGKKVLRLDYHLNPTTNQVDVHWNQRGVYSLFKIQDHTPVGPGGMAAYRAAQVFRYAGRALLVVAAINDAYRIVTAVNVPREIVSTAGAWAVSWAGCRAGGAVGARLPIPHPLGKAAAILGGCVIGGGIGYFGGYETTQTVYDVVWRLLTPTGEDPSTIVSDSGSSGFSGGGGNSGGGASGSW